MSDIFEIGKLLEQYARDAKPYFEFLRVPTISAGVYVLAAGAQDNQKPHNEDEIYYVLRGNAMMKLGANERAVKEGDVIFVERELDHRFFDIKNDLVLLVIFAPAETS